jgi:hypothetical protein
LQIPGGITTTPQTVQDGNGNATGLSLSSSGASVTTSNTAVVSKNGVQMTAATPRLISDMFGDLPTVKDFGAIGNGVTDDTAAFTAAIAASPTGVAVPAGSYKITGTVTGAFYSFGTVTIVTGTVTSIQNVSVPYSASTGSTFVGTTNGGTGAVTRTVASKLNDIVHINDFNGDLLNAIAATPIGGILQLGAGPYVANFVVTRSDITVRGVGMPFYNAGKTALVGGTIIQGKFGFIGDNITVTALGIDSGSNVCAAINAGVFMDCLVILDPTRTIRKNITVRDVLTLCQSATAACHNFLLEGLSDSRFENLHAYYGQWGVVLKTQFSTADGLYAYSCSQAGFTLKSDTGVAGSPANNTTVSNVLIDNTGYPTAAQGILIYAASADLTDCALTNFFIKGGIEGLKFLCNTRVVGAPYLKNVAISNGLIRDQTTYGFTIFGAAEDIVVSNINISNVTSNYSIIVYSDCLGVTFSNIISSAPAAHALNIYLQGRFFASNIYSIVNGDYTTLGGIYLAPETISTYILDNYVGSVTGSAVIAWTPTFTGLTTTGTVTVTGRYSVINNYLFFTVQISCAGAATSASTASTTYINNLPFTSVGADSLNVINGVVGGSGIGLIQNNSTFGYTPTWTAYNGTMNISGSYRIKN